ncbi:hypothetical protein FB45DRAFT_1103105 [Roridomyces roridus]|uniref:Uncharacterized protein n=1 Tax=Roridomyces roridus TaxID=1738132 RepID=A0AAD7BD54_9AGAR|nr:hypothetical protein FB45DRAFT_1103105 [Roridomyces roridus]
MFQQFLSSVASEATAGIESLNLSNTEEIACRYYENFLPTVPDLSGLANLRALKLENFTFAAPMVRARLLQALDLDLSDINECVPDTLRPLLESHGSQINTLVLRKIRAWPTIQYRPSEAHSLRSLAVSLYSSFRWGRSPGGFEPLKRIIGILEMPNLERLEILGGFTGETREELDVDGWPAPLLPCLQTLRLQDICFSRANLALIQSISRGITHLELIDTHGHGYLLHSDLQWPHPREITVEPCDANAFVPWVARFVDLQSRAGTPTESSDIILRLLHPRKLTFNPKLRAPSMRWLWDGPSHTLFDNISPSGRGFYVGADKGPVDFERVQHPKWCECRHWENGTCACISPEPFFWNMRDEHAQWLDNEIMEAFAITGEVLRRKWLCQRKKEQRPSGQLEGRRKGRRSRGSIQEIVDEHQQEPVALGARLLEIKGCLENPRSIRDRLIVFSAIRKGIGAHTMGWRGLGGRLGSDESNETRTARFLGMGNPTVFGGAINDQSVRSHEAN